MLYQHRLQVIDQIILGAESCSTPDLRAKAIFLKDQNLSKVDESKLWKRVLSESQLAFAKTLCDIIIPADALGPKATDLHVHDFINEWYSVPCQDQPGDLQKLVVAIEKFNELSLPLFKKDFASLSAGEGSQVLDEMIARRRTDLKSLFSFFVYFRKVTGVAYYMTSEGEAAIGYTHENKADSVYIGPPPGILKKLGFENGDT